MASENRAAAALSRAYPAAPPVAAMNRKARSWHVAHPARGLHRALHGNVSSAQDLRGWWAPPIATRWREYID
jgi:D-alanyl-D-alanine carboxypeptidase